MAPYKCRWGILGCGGIAKTFTKDLLLDPKTRGTDDIEHIVQAAASSTSKDKASQFLQDVKAPAGTTAYGSYEELVQDKDVDIVYIATPHSHHFQNAMLVLNAGKPVLCEKPFTVNAKQLEVLVKTAKEKNLFLMEAVWTRFFPLSVEARKLVKGGNIGEVKRVVAELGFNNVIEEEWGDTHRMVNLDLAGGALLDLGLYPLTWVFQMLYHISPKPTRPNVTGSMHKYKTGADENTVVICEFPTAIGVAMCGMRVGHDPDEEGTVGPSVRIQGTQGEIQILGPAYRPRGIKIIPKKGSSWKVEEKMFGFPAGGTGMFWQADESARALRDGKLESSIIPHEESLAVVEVMDKMRKIGDLVYPEKIESTQYPLQL